jgi:hypothetical protein
MIDRVKDVGAVYDALPVWFGPRVDMERVGIMGHSRGSITSLTIGGGSDAWHISPNPRFKAIMGLSTGLKIITANVAAGQITAPTLLVEGTRDQTEFIQASQAIVTIINNNPKAIDKYPLITIAGAFHRSFDSALCAQMQSSASIAQANSAALLDLNTAQFNTVMNLPNGVAMDYCPYDAFINPTNVTQFIYSLTSNKFLPSPANVPRSGVTGSAVKDQVVSLAVSFFGQELNRADGDDRPFSDCLPDEFKNQPPVPDPTQQDLDAAEMHPDEPD